MGAQGTSAIFESREPRRSASTVVTMRGHVSGGRAAETPYCTSSGFSRRRLRPRSRSSACREDDRKPLAVTESSSVVPMKS